MTPAARRILLINPNSTQATTTMMVGIAQAAAGDGWNISGATATRSPPMIVRPAELIAAGTEVVEIALASGADYDGVIVSAFGDPGLEAIQAWGKIPATGICEASMRAAASGGRRFGVATTTPELAALIHAKAVSLGFAALYTGTRCTEEDAAHLVANPPQLLEALAEMVKICIKRDGAEAVIIGGGPLGEAATALEARFSIPVIAPIPAAVQALIRQIAG